MPIDFSPTGLAEASKCYCFPKELAQRVKSYLWAVITDHSDLSPAELASAAACYCYDAKAAKAVLITELCARANAASETPTLVCSAVSLAAGAKQYRAFDHETAERVKIRLMVEIAGLSDLTPAQLAQRAACYCMDAQTAAKIPLYALCT